MFLLLVLQGKGEYDGYFCTGTYHGRGSIRYASGDMYNGNFERESIHGEGALNFAGGVVAQGTWNNNRSARISYSVKDMELEFN